MTHLVQNTWLLLPLTLLLSAGLAWLLIPFAMKIGWVDHPGERKVHESKTPTIGGAAVFVALITAFFVARTTGAVPDFATVPFFLVLLMGGAVLFLTGLLDDLVELNVLLRLFLQMAVCLAIIHFTGVQLHDFGRLFSAEVFVLGWPAVAITIFAALGVINSFNLIDGMDGLSGAMFHHYGSRHGRVCCIIRANIDDVVPVHRDGRCAGLPHAQCTLALECQGAGVPG